MRLPTFSLFLATLSIAMAGENPYPPAETRQVSPGSTIYHIDPVHGDDTASGTRFDRPWRSFHNLNQLRLAAGDRVEIIRPGPLDRTLSIRAEGTSENPVRVRFAPGRYDFRPEEAYREAWQISNTNHDPDGLKAAAIHIADSQYVDLTGPGAEIVQRGKAIHVCIEHARHVTVQRLAFDYHRPTVSEFTVTEVGADSADLSIHADSAYRIEDGQLVWVGEGWEETGGLGQNLDPATGRVFRQVGLLDDLRFEEVEPGLVRARGAHRLQVGRVYQMRNPFRDCVGVFTQHSRDITWRDVRFHYIHGMGVINQFSEDLTFEGVMFAPPPGSGRTTSAFADCIQASGCRGRFVVRDGVFQGAHDDAINVHGTHLRVISHDSASRIITVRFMHDATFGFEAFFADDDIEFVRHDTLETYGPNRVVRAELLDPHNMRLQLADPLPTDIRENDVVENVTWTPEVEITGCVVRHIPTRGFLVTTRRPVLIEDNEFHATHMPGILVEADARGWFESGVVRDMVIRNNRFYHCGRAAIHIHPQNSKPNPAVHQNIRIEDNLIIPRNQAAAVIANGTRGLHIRNNTILGDPGKPPGHWFRISNSEDVKLHAQ